MPYDLGDQSHNTNNKDPTQHSQQTVHKHPVARNIHFDPLLENFRQWYFMHLGLSDNSLAANTDKLAK